MAATLKSKSKPKPNKPSSEPEVDEVARLGSADENSDSEDEMGEEGLKRVMELLGDDGLDEAGQMQLGMLGEDAVGDEGDEEDDEDEVNGGKEGEEDEGSDGIPSESGENVEEDHDEDIALDALDDDNVSLDADAVPRQKITIDNEVALRRIRESIQLDPSWPWTETLACTYPEKIELEDVNDDLTRELAFYKQALHTANLSRTLAASSNPPLPYTRPSDYYAEMIKSDAHMARIRQRLLDEQAGMKKGEEKRKEREHKKIGKQVQIEKLKERRERGKAEVEKVKGVKRNRANMEDPADFDVGVDDGGSPPPSAKRAKTGNKPGISRKGRDQKFGFGGKVGWRSKQNTRESTEQAFGDGGKKGKGKGQGHKAGGRGKKGAAANRPGKSRRANARK